MEILSGLWLITIPLSRTLRERAIEIDPHLASAYLARGLLKRDLLGDLVGAERDRDRAISIDPRIV